ncbi:MAG TPA: hypothetical protein VKB62_11750 [Streptosporangiaceae bacterium]|nr:hypothetical protein [Streptosporangiaceae bacterium]
MTGATVRRRLSIVSGFFAFLQARGDVLANLAPRGLIWIGRPDAAHQLRRLAEVQRRDPVDDLVVFLCPGQHSGLPA